MGGLDLREYPAKYRDRDVVVIIARDLCCNRIVGRTSFGSRWTDKNSFPLPRSITSKLGMIAVIVPKAPKYGDD